MQFIKSLGAPLVMTLALTLAACGNPAMEVVPTPTPRDAALDRLNQPQPVAEAVANSGTDAVAETSAGSTAGGTGEQIFTTQGCIACHVLEGDGPNMIGPSLAGMGATADERIAASDYAGEATTAEEYIHESIINPQGYLVPDFAPVMPPTYEQTIPPDQLDQLVSYLASLK